MQNNASKKLNLGCGDDIRSGWVNLDSANIPGVDIVHNIEQLPLPFQNSEFSEILCQDILEHVEYINILKDLHRILTPGGILHIRVPHFSSKNNYIDPTHIKRFSMYTFEFFVKNSPLSKSKQRQYYFDFHFSKVKSARITFDHSSRWLILNRFVEPTINMSRTTKFLYESTGLCYIFPAQNLEVELVK
jgi:SAM-dependent methyltransferase